MPYNLLEGQVAIVTGAAGGYGEGIARVFHTEGASVVIADINEVGQEQATSLSQKGPRCIFVKTDVTKAAEWKRLVDKTLVEFGNLHVLVNNAGWTYKRRDTLSVDEAEYDRVFDINVKSIFHSTHAVIPHFLSKGYGAIVNISSCITEKATTGLTWYGATKGAVDMITRHLATEYSHRGVRVNSVSPSLGATSLISDFLGEEPTQQGLLDTATLVPVHRMCTPTDIAKAALYFASPHFNDFQTGVVLRAEGGTYA